MLEGFNRVIFFIVLFIMIIIILLVILEYKRKQTQKAVQVMEETRRKQIEEKMMESKKKQEITEKEREKEIKRQIEKQIEEKKKYNVELEKRKKNEKYVAFIQGMVNEVYKTLRTYISEKELQSEIKKCLTQQSLMATMTEKGFAIQGMPTIDEVQDFINSIFLRLDERIGEPIVNLSRNALKKYIHENAGIFINQVNGLIEKLKIKELKGCNYLIQEEEPEKSYKLFINHLHMMPGLCITRQSPEKIRIKYTHEFDLLWLSTVKEKDTIDPNNLERLMGVITNFLGDGNKILLIDGLEYLIVQNNYKTVLKFIQSLNSTVLLKKSILITPLNPKTLDEKELAYLEREMTVIK